MKAIIIIYSSFIVQIFLPKMYSGKRTKVRRPEGDTGLSALKLYKIHNKGPLICQLNVEFEDFQSMKFSENSNFTQYFKKSLLFAAKGF